MNDDEEGRINKITKIGLSFKRCCRMLSLSRYVESTLAVIIKFRENCVAVNKRKEGDDDETSGDQCRANVP